VGFDVQDLFVQVTVIIHVKSTLPHKTHGAALLIAGLDGIQNRLARSLKFALPACWSGGFFSATMQVQSGELSGTQARPIEPAHLAAA
jgi:hypothetical protein